MNKITVILFLCMISMSWDIQAHQPDYSSTVLIEQEDNTWILNIRAALTAYEYVVHHEYGDTSYASAAEFQELVVQHMRENLEIETDGNKLVEFENGVVKLGHETNVFFEVKGMPEDFTNIKVTNTGFKDVYNNQSTLAIFKKGVKPNKFTLNNKNDHTLSFSVKEDEIIANDKQDAGISLGKSALALMIIPVLGILFFKFRANRN